MKTSNQLSKLTTIMLGLVLSAITLLTSCTPKYGCYYGMTTTSPTPTDECTQGTENTNAPTVEITMRSR